jgi:membrane protein DedA with SNARE-associated domain
VTSRPPALALGPSDVLHSVLELSGWPAYLLVGFLAFAEAAVFVGFVLPGETAVVLGGVLANFEQVGLTRMILVVVAAAIVGDSVGYEVGRHYGHRVLRLRILQKRAKAVDRAAAYLRVKGGRAVFLGRFTAFLRAVMPGLAGTARMPYRRFLAFNAAGGIVWGTGFVLVGYAAGAGYEHVEKVAGRASTGVLVVVVLVLAANALRLRRKERHGEGLGPMDDTPSADGSVDRSREA